MCACHKLRKQLLALPSWLLVEYVWFSYEKKENLLTGRLFLFHLDLVSKQCAKVLREYLYDSTVIF